MAYFMEMSADPDEGLYLEIAVVDKNTGRLIPGNNVDHQFNVYGWQDCDDYGFWGNRYQTIASNSNGMITAPAPGVIAIAIPPRTLFGGLCDIGWFAPPLQNRVLRFKLLAVSTAPAVPAAVASQLLVKGTISFGGRVMPCPRIQLGAYPLYPASLIIGAQVAQVKKQLANIGAYDTIQAALTGGETDAATLSWNTGGTVTQGGPLMALISQKLFNFDVLATAAFIASASALPL